MHVDGLRSGLNQAQNSEPFVLHELIQGFFSTRTGIPMLVNTSLNVGGEPLACSPTDAVRAFFDYGIDAKAIGPFWVERKLSSSPTCGSSTPMG